MKNVVFIVRVFLQDHTCTNSQMQNTRAVSSTSHILARCQNPRVHDVAIRDGVVCVSASGWKHSRRELFAMYRKRAGQSGSMCRLSGTDVDTQHETPRHDRACRVTTPRSMIDRAHVKRHTSTRHSTALHDMLWLHISSHETHQ